jgi:hypothetical protein
MEGVRAEALGQTKLAFDDLVNQLYAGQDPPGVEEALESEHRAHAAFYPPVILFDNVVQVGTVSNLDGTAPTVVPRPGVRSIFPSCSKTFRALRIVVRLT